MNDVDPILLLCIVTVAFAVFTTWLVLRPIERARREARRAREHAAE